MALFNERLPRLRGPVVPDTPIAAGAWNESRQQVEGIAVTDSLLDLYPLSAAGAVLVGITHADMCAADSYLNHHFYHARVGLSEPAGVAGVAVDQSPRDEDVVDVIARAIGAAYGVAFDQEGHSFLRQDSIFDLDDVREMTGFCPEQADEAMTTYVGSDGYLTVPCGTQDSLPSHPLPE